MATMATARVASISPSRAPPEGPVAAGADMVGSGVGEGFGVGGGAEVAEGGGGDGGEVGAIVITAGALVASTVGMVGDGASVGFVSVGATLMLGEGEGDSMGVSFAGLVTIGVGEGKAVGTGGGVSITRDVGVGMEVAVAVGAAGAVGPGAGVAVVVGTEVVGVAGAAVAVAVGTEVTVAAGVVGASALPTTTRPPSTATCWILAAVSNTWTSCNSRSLPPSPWAMQVIVAKTPAPLGPGAFPKLTAQKVTLPSALFTSGPVVIAGFPVLSKKSPRDASVTCRMDGSYTRLNWKAPRLSASSITTCTTKVSFRCTARAAGSILTRVLGAIALTSGIPAAATVRVIRRMMISGLPLGIAAPEPQQVSPHCPETIMMSTTSMSPSLSRS